MTALYTLGYEGLALDEFLARLHHARIDRLIDIRALPLSRRRGFSKSPLGDALAGADIEYLHLRAAGNPFRKEAEALSYMTSEVHATYGGHFNTQKFAQSEAAQEEVKHKTYDKLATHYKRMDGTLSGNGGEWYLGQRSFADTFLYVLTRWIGMTPISIDDYPALKQQRARMEANEGVRQALARQDMEPIG